MSGKIDTVSNLTLNQMLNKYRVKKSKDEKAEKAIITHTGLEGPYKGSYFVPDEKMEQLYNCILNAESQPSITEQIQNKDMSAVKKMYIDFDFKQEGRARVISEKDVKNLIHLYALTLTNYSDVKEFTIYVQQRPKPYKAYVTDKETKMKKAIYKDGLHFIIPDFLCSIEDQFKIRLEAIKGYPKMISHEFINDGGVDDIIDKSIIQTNGWFLQGCGKEGTQPYKTICCVKYTIDDKDDLIREFLPIPDIDIEFMKLCSMHYSDTSKFYKVDLPDLIIEETKIHKPRKASSEIIKCSEGIMDEKTIAEFRDLLAASPEKLSYEEWFKIMCICKFHRVPYKVVDAFMITRDGYDAEENMRIWNGIKGGKESQLTKGSLYKTIKDTNILKFYEIKTKYAPPIGDFWATFSDMEDLDIARIYYNLAKDKYIYSPFLGWFEFSEHGVLKNIPGSGKPAPPKLMENIADSIRALCVSHRIRLLPDSEDYKKKNEIIDKLYKGIASTAQYKKLISPLVGLYENNEIHEQLNQNINLIAFDNILYDYSIPGFRKIEPTDFISKTCGYSITTDRNDEIRKKIMSILWEIFENEEVIEYWLSITANSFFGNSSENIYFLIGEGGNGKGLLSEIILKALGSYAFKGESTFFQEKAKSGAINSTLAQLGGVRYFLVSEPKKGLHLDESIIKELTGGGKILMRDVFVASCNKYLTFTPFMETNSMPTLPEAADPGIIRRPKFINFPNNFVPADQIKEKHHRLRNDSYKQLQNNPEFIQEFMLLLLEYASKNKDKVLIAPITVTAKTTEFFESTDPIKEFLSEHYIITDDKNDRIKSSDLLHDYNSINKDAKLTAQSLAAAMKFNKIERVKNSVYYYACLKLKPEEREPCHLETSKASCK